MTLWIVGIYHGTSGAGAVNWELVGLFSTEQLARAACRTHGHFVGPAPPIDVDLGDTPIEWPGSYFPIAPPEAPPDA